MARGGSGRRPVYLYARLGAVPALALLLLLAALLILAARALETGAGLGAPALLGLGLLLVLALLRFWVLRPFRAMERLLSLFSAGYTLETVLELPFPYSAGMSEAFGRFETLLDMKAVLQASKRQEQFLALQNQINPHFLYNTLEGIRSDALAAGLLPIAKMTEALSSFFRYTTSTMDHLVSLEDELGSIDSYFIIQQYRFGERLSLTVSLSPDEADALLRCRMPKLILQPLVENSIIHGLERKVGPGSLRIAVESTADRLLVSIRADGVGMPEARLAELRAGLAERSMTGAASPGQVGSGGGIALVNVNNRLKLLFGEQYGLDLTSLPGVGTEVSIVLPLLRGEEGARLAWRPGPAGPSRGPDEAP